jgi:uncharacterized protein YjbI with pentapeptide repeats
LTGRDAGAGATFANDTLERCVLIGCGLVGATFDTVSAKDVIFDNCRLDCATFERFKIAGPVAFVRCSLTEAEFRTSALTTAVFDDCELAGVAFDTCDVRGADLRGNDIAGLTAGDRTARRHPGRLATPSVERSAGVRTVDQSNRRPTLTVAGVRMGAGPWI